MFRAFLDRWGWAVVLVFAAATLGLGAFLPRVDVDASTNMLLDEKDPDLAYYTRSRRLWSNDDEFAIVCCRKADWFTPEALATLKQSGTIAGLAKEVPSFREFFDLLGMPEVQEMEARYGVSEEARAKY